MWKLAFFVLAAVIMHSNFLTQIPSVSKPDINSNESITETFSIDISSLIGIDTLKKVKTLITGFGAFNLGANVENIEFKLYTSKNNYSEELIVPENPLSDIPSWDKAQKIIIVIHGYAEDSSGGPLSLTLKIIDALIQAKRPENLIFVDWRYLARQANYFASAKNTVPTGMRVAELIIALRSNSLCHSLDDFHLIGFSLGAHVSGIAAHCAYKVLEEEGAKIGRITGLDPAGPGFREEILINRLDESDAKFVDVVHTNMGPYLTTFGVNIKSGHIDFYPNGGENQPGCAIPLVSVFLELEPVGICSHIQAPKYFADTILGVKYIGCPCSDWHTYKNGSCQCSTYNGALMGHYADQSITGDYYLAIPSASSRIGNILPHLIFLCITLFLQAITLR